MDAAEKEGMRFLQEYAAEIKLPMKKSAIKEELQVCNTDHCCGVRLRLWAGEIFGARTRTALQRILERQVMDG